MTCESIWKCPKLQNVAAVLQEAQRLENMDKSSHTMYEFINEIYINNTYGIKQFINDYTHLMMKHKDEYEDICGYLQSYVSTCDIYSCHNIRRNYRDRSNCKLQQKYKHCSSECEVVIMQLIDKIHCYYFHAFDRGLRLTLQEKQQMGHVHRNDKSEL